MRSIKTPPLVGVGRTWVSSAMNIRSTSLSLELKSDSSLSVGINCLKSNRISTIDIALLEKTKYFQSFLRLPT